MTAAERAGRPSEATSWFLDVVPGHEPAGDGTPGAADGGVAFVLGTSPDSLLPVHRGRGVVFPSSGGSGERHTRHLVEPRLRVREHGFELAGRTVDVLHGEPVPGPPVVLASSDLSTFLERPASEDDADSASGPVPIDEGTAAALLRRHGTVRHVATHVPDVLAPAGAEVDLSTTLATLRYSDGSTTSRFVRWDVTRVTADALCAQEVWGSIEPDDLPFPFVLDRADPSALFFDGAWLFVATDDRDGDNQSRTSLMLRRAPTLEALRDADDHVVVSDASGDRLAGCFWAPELHVIGGRLSILFAPALDKATWAHVRCHITQLHPGGDPTDAEDWDSPREIRRADGSPLELSPDHPGISLDMTFAETVTGTYVLWSQRTLDAAEPEPALWISTIDPLRPDRLTSEPVRLLTPELAWHRRDGAVIEGPYVLVHGEDVWLAYSAGGVGPHYAVGLLRAPVGADLTDTAVWERRLEPVQAADPTVGRWGPGHGAFAQDADGTWWHVHHAKAAPDEPARHTAVERVHWASDGRPVLDMRPDERLAPHLRRVRVRVVARDDL